MSNLVHEHRGKLEVEGEYVTLANVGWFALFPKTLSLRESVGRERGRADINLVVYRTASADRRDHHVIPMTFVKQLLSDATLSDSVTGDKRWNMVLDNGTDRLKVTHGEHDLDVACFRALPLITEDTPAFDSAEPLEDRAELDARVRELQAIPELVRPMGTSTPMRQPHSASQSPIARRPDVKAWVLQQANGECELCVLPAPFHSGSGQPYLEHHHVVQLAHGGPDTIENSVALCPNCHRRLHLGADRDEQRERLYGQIERLLGEPSIPNEPG